MNKKFFPALVLSLVISGCFAQKQSLTKVFADAETQTLQLLKEAAATEKSAATPGVFTPRTLENGNLRNVASRDWTSGFFPGVLWYLYDFTGKKQWLQEAKTYTAQVEKEKTNGTTHDMGFKVYCSFGNGYRLTKDPAYREVIIQSARTLATRFNPTVGAIKSWDHHNDVWPFPVIIDNMMNLELLFEATNLTGDSTYYKVAVAHANTTMKNHFRPDYSSYHVIAYDPATGKVLKKNTHQGFSHESAWARGQAWALYGYTLCYRETRDKAYLAQAENVAKFIFSNPHMPADLVPYWDFDAPGIPNEPRDASAAAVIASGLYELSTYSSAGKDYVAKADKILASLTGIYRSPIGGNKGFILGHSTGSKPSNSEVDVPLNYADYYYLEALLRQKRLAEKKSVVELNKKN
ncbi:glycoside hydrolase family 88 protein [Hufsiella ginkgonis]|uniref:Glucuronyl hydrolase n=1 Tax=Hufsiella ginkgonis TaxID=2695274 RepID=A0A7K1XW39_9SPHI|nr:glycoside hydrolase family 88 protein [Hufsiella ginkgonis]MXV14989.1 glucuronyl hydrolase [Hufsiella ginkgonis]